MGCGTRLQGELTTPKGSKKKLLIGIGTGVGVLAIIAGISFFLIREDGSNPQNVDAQKPNPAKTETKVGGKKPEPNIAVSRVERAIRKAAKKPTGELTKEDLERVTRLDLATNGLTEVPKELEKLTQVRVLVLDRNQLTVVKALENLTQLTSLALGGNPDLTKAQIDVLQKALPKCRILSNPTK